jgi:hypothetical protein
VPSRLDRDDGNQYTLKRDEHWFRFPIGAPAHRGSSRRVVVDD